MVPDEEPWPKAARKIGLKLGVRVAAMRSAGRYVKVHVCMYGAERDV